MIALDCGFAVLDEFPTRQVIQVGCREQAAVGLAAGMATGGMKPMVYSIAKFLIWRGLEFIEQDVILPELPVKFIGYGAGLYFHRLGKSHMTYGRDIDLCQAIGLRISRSIDEFMADDGPCYVRLFG